MNIWWIYFTWFELASKVSKASISYKNAGMEVNLKWATGRWETEWMNNK